MASTAEYWDPQRIYPNPYQSAERAVVFVGAMDYRANVHAAQWFAREVWPRIFARCQDARLYLVGSKPAAAVRALGELAGITVTGRVDDVRPYLAHAHAVAAPLRIARGIQNKVLEALAMEKVVLATPEAWEGIEDFAGRQGCISDSPEVMANEALRWLDAPQVARVPAARAMVLSRFDWVRNLDTYERVMCDAQRGMAAVHAAGVAGAGGGFVNRRDEPMSAFPPAFPAGCWPRLRSASRWSSCWSATGRRCNRWCGPGITTELISTRF